MPFPRRSFLKTMAASVVPSAALHDLIAQVPAPPNRTNLHIVGSGQDRFGEQHSLGFSSMSFKVTTAETAGNMFVIEHVNLKPNGGPGLHLHFNQEEYFYVLEGEVAFQVGDQKLNLKAGESVLGPRRIQHCFAGVAPASRLLIAFTPAGEMERFFRETEKNPKLVVDAEFNRQCEVQSIGPSPFWKA